MDPLQTKEVIRDFKRTLNNNKINVKTAEFFIDRIKDNIYLLTEVLYESERVLMDEKVSLLQKINCVYLLKLMLETGQCVCVMLIEVYMLGVLQQIAITGSQASSTVYYNDLGYTQEQVMQQYQKLAAEAIKIGSAVKPKHMYQCIELSEPSLFAKSLHKVMLNSSQELIIDQSLQNSYNRTFLMNSKNFQQGTQASEDFMKYFLQRTLQLIEAGLQNRSRPKKSTEFFSVRPLLRLGSYYINYDVLGISVDVIQNNDNIEYKINALNLLNQMIIWGDLQALLIINYSDLLDNIFANLYVDKKSYRIYQNIHSQQSIKQKYLTNLLRFIELWARLNPNDNLIDKQNKNCSKICQYQRQLKQLNQPSLTFPENPFLRTLQNQYKTNLKVNEERNQKILEDTHYRSVSITNKMNSSSFYKSSTFLYLKLKQTIENVTRILNKTITALQNSDPNKRKPVFQTNINPYLTELKKQKNNIGKNVDILLDKDCSINTQNHGILESCSECIDIIENVCMQGTQCQNKKIKISQFRRCIEKNIQKLGNIKNQQDQCNQSDQFSSQGSIRLFIHQKYKNISNLFSFQSDNVVKNSLFTSQKFDDGKKSIKIAEKNSHPMKSMSMTQLRKKNAEFEKINIPSDVSDTNQEEEMQKKQLKKSHPLRINNSASQLPQALQNKIKKTQPIQSSTFQPILPPNINPQKSLKFATIFHNISEQLLPLPNKQTQLAAQIAADRDFKIKKTSSTNSRCGSSKTKSNTKSTVRNRNSQIQENNQQYMAIGANVQESKNGDISKVIKQYYSGNTNCEDKRKTRIREHREERNNTINQYNSQKYSASNILTNFQTKTKQKLRNIFTKNRLPSPQPSPSGQTTTNKNRKRTIFGKSPSSIQNLDTSNFLIANNSNIVHNSSIQNLTKQNLINQSNNIQNISDLPIVSTTNNQFYKNKQMIKYESLEKRTANIITYNSKFKKKLLKRKNLIVKNEDLEIGCVVNRGNQLEVCYYISPKCKIQSMETICAPRSSLKIKQSGYSGGKMQANSQYVIKFHIQMINCNYKLPQLKFKYRTLHPTPKNSEFTTLLPILPTKFLQFKPTSAQLLQQNFNSLKHILYTQIIPHQASIPQSETLLFQYLELQQFNKLKNNTILYGCRCVYKDYEFLLKVVYKSKQMICFEGMSLTEDEQFMEHCLCELYALFCAEMQ